MADDDNKATEPLGKLKDVSQDLLQAGSFGGPTPAADPFPARAIIWLTLVPVACLAVILTPAFFAVRRRLFPGTGDSPNKSH